MKKILITVIVLILCLGLTLLFFSRMQSDTKESQVNVPSGVGFPTANPNQGTSTKDDPFPNDAIVDVTPDTISLQLSNGVREEVNDFIDNGVTIQDVVNPGTYILAGSLGYCLGDGSCPSGAVVEGFSVEYNKNFNQFSILLKEPLRVNRIKAEEFMMKTLGIERRNICELPYWIGTTSYTNHQYAGLDFRFSSCPGAVALP